MSGQASLDYLQQTCRGAAHEVLSKPFRPDALLRAVRAALDRPAVAPVVSPPRRQKPVQDSQEPK
jgi:hypothetical protein